MQTPYANTSAPQEGAETTQKTRCQKALWVALAIQVLGSCIFLFSTWTEVFHLREYQLDWRFIEAAEILGSLALLLGGTVSVLFLRKNHTEITNLRRQVDVASGAYASHIDELFAQWQLSNSERDVAIYAMKGFSNPEISRIRGTSVPTTKSQMSSIFRKSGHTSRQQLIAFLVEEMLSGLPQEQAREAPVNTPGSENHMSKNHSSSRRQEDFCLTPATE